MAAVLSLVGVGVLLLMTRQGIGTSPDSVHYIKAARQLLGERAAASGDAIVAGDEESLTHFAPLYSLLLAAGGVVGVEPMEGARWLNAIVFGLNIFLVGFIIRRSSRHVTWLWIAGSLLMLGSIPVLSVHVAALSEPVFLLCGLLGMYLLARYLENARLAFLAGAAVAISLAFLARYAGAAWIITGGIAILLWGPRPTHRRFRDALLFGTLSSLPMVGWMARNMALAGSATGRELFFHPIDKSHVWQALYTASGWILVPPGAPDVVRLALWAVVAIALAAILFRQRADGAPMPPVISVLALFVGVYAAFLSVSISLLDANTQLDDRILLPVFAAGLMVSLHLLDGVWPWLRARRALAYPIAAVVTVFLAVHLVNGVEVAAASYARGWGFTSRAWQQSPTLARTRALAEDVLIYSNAPEIVYLHTGRPAHPLPKKVLLMNRTANPDFAAQMSATEQALADNCGVVVFLRNLADQKSVPGEREAASVLSLRVQTEERDGAILSSSECPAQ